MDEWLTFPKGKGYPDLATRTLCQRLSTLELDPDQRRIPMYALVDWDPDGLGILSTYKYGSAALQMHDNPRLPYVKWLGLHSDDACRSAETRQGQTLLQMTDRDRRKARKMLEWSHLGEEGQEDRWRREVQLMLMLNYKAEIQSLDEMEGGVQAWLEDRLVGAGGLI